jgi:hypothetical protein
MRSGLTGLILLFSARALAQPPPPPPGGMVEGPSPDGTQSVLPNLLSTAAGGTIDARMDATLDSESDLTVFAINMHGQYIAPSGIGGYASVPFFYATADGESQNSIGNAEVGGLYVLRQAPDTDIVLRGGLAFDTADQEDILIIVAGQISPKLVDIYASGFATTWARAQVQVRHASGNLRLGGSIGFDLPVDGLAKDASFDGALTAIGAVGVQGPSVGFGVAFTLLKALNDQDNDDDTFNCVNATIDFPVGGKARFFGSFGYPEIDENEFDLFSVGAGIRAGF